MMLNDDVKTYLLSPEVQNSKKRSYSENESPAEKVTKVVSHYSKSNDPKFGAGNEARPSNQVYSEKKILN